MRKVNFVVFAAVPLLMLAFAGPASSQTKPAEAMASPMFVKLADAKWDKIAPELGDDTEAILREVLDLSPDDIAGLHRTGAIG